MTALRPAASRLGLRSSGARRSEPLRKCNATAQAVEGNLGGFCVCGQIGLACYQILSEGAHVNSTLKIQNSEAMTLLEKIKLEIKKRAEAKAKHRLLKQPKRPTKRYS
jgi:hypothetical protein